MSGLTYIFEFILAFLISSARLRFVSIRSNCSWFKLDWLGSMSSLGLMVVVDTFSFELEAILFLFLNSFIYIENLKFSFFVDRFLRRSFGFFLYFIFL
jgi:hypothetical protein